MDDDWYEFYNIGKTNPRNTKNEKEQINKAAKLSTKIFDIVTPLK